MRTRKLYLFGIVLLLVSLSCSLSSSQPAAGVSGLVPHGSGLIDKVTMAKTTQGTSLDPVNATTVFNTDDIFHAVVHLVNSPDSTDIKVIWYTVNVGSSDENNSEIDSYSETSSGTRNIDFSLEPINYWLTGTYQVEIYINGNLDQFVNFSVK